MGVYIKGMTLGELNDCIMAGAYIAPEEAVEVTKPHGRIIDESEIKTVYGRELLKHNNGYTTAIHRIAVTDAPTVIEAEGE